MKKKKPIKTKGIKYDSGKAPLNLISGYALDEIAGVLKYGAFKYDPWNWAEGLIYSRLIAATKRHIQDWENRDDLDVDVNCKKCIKKQLCEVHSGRHHLAHAACNLMFILDYEARGLVHLDDRRPAHTLKKIKVPKGYNKVLKASKQAEKLLKKVKK